MKFLMQDVRFSLRLLRKSPGFTLAAVLTLAMGIGANAVVFAVLNGLILQPLNIPDSDSFYEIERLTDFTAKQSYLDYLDFHDRNKSFEELSAYSFAQAGVDTGENTSRSWLEEVSGNYFDVLKLQPYLGRFFHGSDEHGFNSAPYIVLTYAYWHSHFRDDRGVVGRIIQVNRHPFTVIGVSPPKFHGTLLFFSPDFFVPLVNQEQVEGTNILTDRGNRFIYETAGHLKPGVTPAQAAADVNAIWDYLDKAYPKDHTPMKFALARPALYGDFFGRPMRAFLGGLMLLAGLILLAACANLGSLFVLRAADRSREVALRLALGSSRKRIVRQLFTEAILISLIGGAVGLSGSLVLLRALSVWRPFPQFPLNLPANPDANVFAAALLLTLVSAFLFGAVPIRQILRTNSYEIIKSGPTTAGVRRVTTRDVLLAVQIAICAVLVTSSMVAVRGLVRSLHSNFGFDPQNAVLVNTNLRMAGYSGDGLPAMQRRMIDATYTIPGVTSVGLVDWAPLAGEMMIQTIFTDQTAELTAANAVATAASYNISPEYFQAAGTTLLAGRPLSWHDDKNSTRVSVVNREFAKRLFGSPANAIGQFYKVDDGTRLQVVGIVEDGKYASLTEDPRPAIFLPISQVPSSETWLVVRSNDDAQQLSAGIRHKLRELDSGLPCFIETWSDALHLVLFPSRMAAMSLGVLGIMGGLLSIIGIFGVAAYSVSKRHRELGIRIALGAQRTQVSRAALGRPVKLLVFGSAAGLFLGILASKVLASIVYQATARDPVVLAGVVLSMFLLGLVGTWIPLQRALSIDASMLLRDE